MKIAVLGATGATGFVFTRMALESGHEVVALVRNPAKLSLSDSKLLTVVVGDALSSNDVTTVVTGADVVVSCLGHVPGGPCPMMSVAFANIMAASAQQDPPPRCVLMTTIGMPVDCYFIYSSKQPVSLPECFSLAFLSSFRTGVGGTSAFVKCFLGLFLAGRNVIADYEKADALVREGTYNVPFVLVRPGHLMDGQATGKYKVSQKGFYHIAMQITRADVAAFLLRAASSDEHDNKAVQLFS